MTTSNTINPNNWITNYYKYLKNYTKARVSNPADVEEIISDTFLAALKAKDNFKNKCTERTWLTSILKHKIIDYYRSKSSNKGKIHHYTISHDEHQEQYYYDAAFTFSEASTLADMNLENLESVLHNSLNIIPQSQSTVARMRIYEDLSTDEICDRLKISKNNAWVLMSRARKSIATHLNKYDYAV